MGRIRTVGLVVKRNRPRATRLATRIVTALRRRGIRVLADAAAPLARRAGASEERARARGGSDRRARRRRDAARGRAARARRACRSSASTWASSASSPRWPSPRRMDMLRRVLAGQLRDRSPHDADGASLERGGRVLQRYRALNDVVVSNGALARIVRFTRVGRRTAVHDVPGRRPHRRDADRIDGLLAVGRRSDRRAHRRGAARLAHLAAHAVESSGGAAAARRSCASPSRAEQQDVVLTVDGQEGMPLPAATCSSCGARRTSVSLVRSPDRTHYDVLRSKLGWGGAGRRTSCCARCASLISRSSTRSSSCCEPGFNVVTGETGAGKSILLQALDVALGRPAGRRPRPQRARRRRWSRRSSTDVSAAVGEALARPASRQVATDELLVRRVIGRGRTDARIRERRARARSRSCATWRRILAACLRTGRASGAASRGEPSRAARRGRWPRQPDVERDARALGRARGRAGRRSRSGRPRSASRASAATCCASSSTSSRRPRWSRARTRSSRRERARLAHAERSGTLVGGAESGVYSGEVVGGRRARAGAHGRCARPSVSTPASNRCARCSSSAGGARGRGRRARPLQRARSRPIRHGWTSVERSPGRAGAPAEEVRRDASTTWSRGATRWRRARAGVRGRATGLTALRPPLRRREGQARAWAERLSAARRRAGAQTLERAWQAELRASRARRRALRGALRATARPLGPAGCDEIEFFLAANPGRRAATARACRVGRRAVAHHAGVEDASAAERATTAPRSSSTRSTPASAVGRGGGRPEAARARPPPAGAVGDASAGDRGVRRSSRRGGEARGSRPHGVVGQRAVGRGAGDRAGAHAGRGAPHARGARARRAAAPAGPGRFPCCGCRWQVRSRRSKIVARLDAPRSVR